MKNIIVCILFFPFMVLAQDNRYGSLGGSATGAIGQTAQDSSGWQDDGTRVRPVTLTDSVGIGQSTAFNGILNIRTSSSATSTTTNSFALEHVTSGTAANNFGIEIRSRLENAGGTTANAGGLSWRWTSASSSNSHMRFITSVGGTNTAFMRLSHTGTLKIAPSVASDATGRLEVINDSDAAVGDSSLFYSTAGRLGIGTGSPGANLDVAGDAIIGTGLKVPVGANPTVDADGEIAVDSDEPAIRFQSNSVDYSLPGIQSARFIVPNPATTDDYPLGSWPANITITQIRVLCIAGTNVVGGLDEADANGANSAVVDADITATAGTTATDDGSLSNATIDADDQLLWHTTSVSGSPTSVTITVYFKYDLVN